MTTAGDAAVLNASIKQKPSFSWNNIAIGAAIQVFEVSTLGQPFEVIKTHMAGIDASYFIDNFI